MCNNNMGGVYLALLSKDTASPFMETDAEVAIESTPAKRMPLKGRDKE